MSKIFLLMVFFLSSCATWAKPKSICSKVLSNSRFVSMRYYNRMHEGYPPTITARTNNLIVASESIQSLLTQHSQKETELYFVIEAASANIIGTLSEAQIYSLVHQVSPKLTVDVEIKGFFGTTYKALKINGRVDDIQKFLDGQFSKRVLWIGNRQSDALKFMNKARLWIPKSQQYRNEAW